MLRWLLLLVLVPAVAAQAPTLTAEVSTGEFLIDGTADFHVNATLTCQAHDADPDVTYTLAFTSLHYTSGGADVDGIEVIVPDPVTATAPCFPGGLGLGSASWSVPFRVIDINATPGAMYHMDLFVTASVDGRLGQTAPAETGVHTMGSAQEVPIEAPAMPAPAKATPGFTVGIAALALWLARK